jgi:hypothetical protein
MIAFVGPRNIGEAFLYIGNNHTNAACIVIERYDDLPKEMRDCAIMFPNETTTWAFDFNLHALDCTGPVEGEVRHVTSRQPCPCGAWPGDPQHKVRRLSRLKVRMQAKMAKEKGDLIWNPETGELSGGAETVEILAEAGTARPTPPHQRTSRTPR